MDIYATFLSAMSVLFVAIAAVMLSLSVIQIARRRGRKAAAYMALTVLACGVAAGFYFFRALF